MATIEDVNRGTVTIPLISTTDRGERTPTISERRHSDMAVGKTVTPKSTLMLDGPNQNRKKSIGF